MSRLQLNFNGGEIDPDEHERIDLKLYDAGLALGENVVARPHGGLSFRGGLRKFSRLRRQLQPEGFGASDVTMPNGGTVADLVSGAGTETTTPLALDDLYVVAEFDFGSPVNIAAIDLNDFFLNDGSAGAGEAGSGGGGTPGGGEVPDGPSPGFWDYGERYYEP